MSGEMIDVQTEDGVADCYLSRPDDGARHPGVLMIMDAFGLRDQIKAMADRVAAEGFTVLAPNVYHRAGRAEGVEVPDLSDPEKRGPALEKIRPLMEALTPEVVVRDGGAYLDKLQELAPGPVGITGYCMGVRIGWRIAAAYPDRVAAFGGFHGGGLVSEEADSPHRSAGALACEVFLGHADNDQSMTPENIAEIEEALSDAGVTYRSELFEGASHGYTMADTPVYDETAAERHFRELFALLDRTIAA